MTGTHEWDGGAYQERFDALAASGVDVHGEASFVSAFGPTTVLDAGCGTGRVAIELDRRGHVVAGVDVDASMLATARKRAPHVDWVHADLASESFDLGKDFDLVVMAGNVPLFTSPGSQPALVAGVARHVAPGGRLVAGFQLDDRYSLSDYDEACALAGLAAEARFGSWAGDPWADGDDYAVSVHRRPDR